MWYPLESILARNWNKLGIGMIVDKAASVNLKRKIKLNNNWAFVPVARKNGHYFPDQVLIARHLDKGKCRYILYEVV
jgi:hypothetical protein